MVSAALLSRLLLAGFVYSRGQETKTPTPSATLAVVLPPPPATLEKTPPASVPPAVAPAAVPVDGAAATPPTSPDGCAACADAKSIWSKVPPPAAPTRLGGFFVLPTGPGFYSLKDALADDCREKPPNYPWPPFSLDIVPFYDNNFRYLDDPKNTQTDWLDPVKRIHLDCDWLLSIGGEERIRYANEVDSRLSGRDNTYELDRSRLYGDLWYRDLFRVFIEAGYEETSNQDLPPSATDVNKVDFINLFADVKVGELNDHPFYVRTGRQELDYGSQRLISQTDFPNSPRTFDGVKGFLHGDKLDVDAFLTRPVVIVPDRFNSENDKSIFAGLWATYRPMKGQNVDLYYLYLDNGTPLGAVVPVVGRGGFDVSTFGSRYAGDWKALVWDFEGMYQFGYHGAQSTSAGAATTGLGVHLAKAPTNPIFWVYYDFASGSHDPGRGQFGTFNQLFPNGHNYFGWTDLVGRQNIDDINLQAWCYPAKWITLGAQYHVLRLDAAKDALYNAAGVVQRVDPTGNSSTNVGDILTGIANFHLSMHSDVLLQYSHLYSGAFIRNTGSGRSPDFFFMQYTFRC